MIFYTWKLVRKDTGGGVYRLEDKGSGVSVGHVAKCEGRVNSEVWSVSLGPDGHTYCRTLKDAVRWAEIRLMERYPSGPAGPWKES